ncbi:hypothetical protein Daus18300_013512 [Diaporthe australafricana]|uniref:Uncharacterized protein n=1 Tax=Diaporthe australafricana TaxID=127596 RepID=A0ABR3VYS6_9PEZI
MSGQPPLSEGPDPDESLSATIIGVSTLFTVFTVICLALRLLSRTFTKVGVKIDDYLAVVATIFLIGIQWRTMELDTT